MMGDIRKRLVELAASVVRGNYDPTEPPPGRWSRVQKWRDHDAAVDRLKQLGLAIKDIADGEAKATTDALRSIATIVGCPANTDPLTDLDGLVSMVRVVTADRDVMRHELGRLQSMLALDSPYAVHDVLARLADAADHLHHGHNCDADGWEMTRAAAASARRIVAALVGYTPPDRDAEVDARIADAVAADRAAAGAWVRGVVTTNAERARNFIARSIEHGDHTGDDAPPLPSLRMVMLLRDELHRQIATLTAERDRRIDPVEHARAVIRAWMSAAEDSSWWVSSPTRTTLLARVGADVLAEVER